MARDETERDEREGAVEKPAGAVSPLFRWGVNLVVVGLIVLFFAAFHLVFPTDDPTAIRLLRKGSLSLELGETFVNLEGYVNRYNKSSDSDQAKIENEALYRKLLAAGFVKQSSP